MPFPADGVDVLRRMTERQEEARRNVYQTPPESEGDSSFLGTPFKLLLLAILLFIIWATGSTP
jgi:hypothetical protein